MFFILLVRILQKDWRKFTHLIFTIALFDFNSLITMQYKNISSKTKMLGIKGKIIAETYLTIFSSFTMFVLLVLIFFIIPSIYKLSLNCC